MLGDFFGERGESGRPLSLPALAVDVGVDFSSGVAELPPPPPPPLLPFPSSGEEYVPVEGPWLPPFAAPLERFHGDRPRGFDTEGRCPGRSEPSGEVVDGTVEEDGGADDWRAAVGGAGFAVNPGCRFSGVGGNRMSGIPWEADGGDATLAKGN